MNNFLGLLALLFIGLKLGAVGIVATWSWWLVLLPLYAGILIAVVAFVLGLLGVGVSSIFSSRRFR